MIERILPYYNQELAYIRESALKFAKAYPKIAKHLQVSEGKIEDPDVARLVESFAFLTANIRYKLEDDFPEVAESLLSVLYPHYLSPIPSCSVIQFQPAPELEDAYFIPKQTLIETSSSYPESCTFKTVYPVMVYPIEVVEVKMKGLPFQAPSCTAVNKAKSVIQLTLSYNSPKHNFSTANLKNLRFFLQGATHHIYPLYKLIFNHSLGIGLAKSPLDNQAVFLNPTCLKTVGFEKDDKLLPFSAHAAQGYDLLAEYFIFPEKFLFFELALDLKLLQNIGQQLEIFIYLNESNEELESNIQATHFKLGCTPIINLFPQSAEPFQLTHTQAEYPIIPDARRSSSSLEIYSIESVKVFNNQGAEIQCQPFYGFQHTVNSDIPSFWLPKRRINEDKLTELSLCFTSLDFSPLLENLEGVVQVETLCSNKNLPGQLAFGDKEPYLQLKIQLNPLISLKCLMPFTPSLHPALREGTYWKLVSHLSLSYLSFAEEEKALEWLKEILRLYNFNDSVENHQIIDRLLSIGCRTITTRSPSGLKEAFCQGTEIHLQFDDSLSITDEAFLFFQVLNHFFSRYAAVNSFTKLIVSAANKGVQYQWPPLAGNNPLF